MPRRTAPPDSAYSRFPRLVRITPVRRKISKKVRRFIHYFAESGFHDVEGAGLAAGLRTATSSWAIYERFRDLIDQERLRRTLGTEMTVDEAMRELAWIARQRDDVKTKHAAIRTVLEAAGALGKDVDPRDRKALMKQAEALIAEIRQRMPRELAAAQAEGEIEAAPTPQPVVEEAESAASAVIDVEATVS